MQLHSNQWYNARQASPGPMHPSAPPLPYRHTPWARCPPPVVHRHEAGPHSHSLAGQTVKGHGLQQEAGCSQAPSAPAAAAAGSDQSPGPTAAHGTPAAPTHAYTHSGQGEPGCWSSGVSGRPGHSDAIVCNKTIVPQHPCSHSVCGAVF